MTRLLPLPLALLAALSTVAACSVAASHEDVHYPPVASELRKAGEPLRLKPIRHTPDVAALLDATIADILSQERLRMTREFYCSEPVADVALTNRGAHYAWPAAYRPRGDGVRFAHVDPDHAPSPGARHRLGLDVRSLEIRGDRARLSLCIFHVGHKSVMGACYVVYSARRSGGSWTVEFESAHD